MDGFDPVLTQFNLGPALTGAQPHFHGDAWNALVYGRKQWFIHPPTSSFFARSGMRALDWLSRSHGGGVCAGEGAAAAAAAEGAASEAVPVPAAAAAAGEGNEADVAELRCVQEAGDLMYVPRL